MGTEKIWLPWCPNPPLPLFRILCQIRLLQDGRNNLHFFNPNCHLSQKQHKICPQLLWIGSQSICVIYDNLEWPWKTWRAPHFYPVHMCWYQSQQCHKFYSNSIPYLNSGKQKQIRLITSETEIFIWILNLAEMGLEIFQLQVNIGYKIKTGTRKCTLWRCKSMPTPKAKLLWMTSHYGPTVVRSVTKIPFHVFIW